MAIVFGLENTTFLAKSDIFIPKLIKGGGAVGFTDLGKIPKKNFFLDLIAGVGHRTCNLPGMFW